LPGPMTNCNTTLSTRVGAKRGGGMPGQPGTVCMAGVLLMFFSYLNHLYSMQRSTCLKRHHNFRPTYSTTSSSLQMPAGASS
jgi:hypothetical protein